MIEHVGRCDFCGYNAIVIEDVDGTLCCAVCCPDWPVEVDE